MLALRLEPHHATTLYDLNQTTPRGFGDFNIKLIRSQDLRWVPVVDWSNRPSSCCYNSATYPPDSRCGPTHLSLIGKSRITIFPMHQSFASGISDSRFPIYRRVFRFTLRGQVRSCDLHSYDHSHTILSGSRDSEFQSVWLTRHRGSRFPDSRILKSRFPMNDLSIGTFPMNLNHR
jgi:hypothetical protein